MVSHEASGNNRRVFMACGRSFEACRLWVNCGRNARKIRVRSTAGVGRATRVLLAGRRL